MINFTVFSRGVACVKRIMKNLQLHSNSKVKEVEVPAQPSTMTARPHETNSEAAVMAAPPPA